jgi:hypothetical protein
VKGRPVPDSLWQPRGAAAALDDTARHLREQGGLVLVFPG